jgi:hypothetical protein
MSAADVLALIDAAPVFTEEDPAATTEAVRKLALAELEEALALVRAAGGDARGVVLAGASQRIGQLVAIEVIHDGFARAALEGAASECGLVRGTGCARSRRWSATASSSAGNSRGIAMNCAA